MFIAPAFLQQGDQDKDGKLSKAEFEALGEKWFKQWDKDKRGKLNEEQLRAGLDRSFAPPDFGRGGAGGRGFAPNLQGAEGKRNGLASAMGIEFKQVHADLEFEGQAFPDVAVRYKGNGTFLQSRASLKRSLKISLNKFVKGQKLAGVVTLNLHNCVTDASWMNEVLSHRLFRDAGVPASRTGYARVFVTVPGTHDRTYFGLYSLVENVDSCFAREHLSPGKGAIFKPVTTSLFADLGGDWARYKQSYDPKREVSPEETARVIAFARLVTEASDADFAAQVRDFLDLDEFARFMAVTVWLSTLDSILNIGQNFYVYLDPGTRRFQFMPWDLDHSFGQFPLAATQEIRETLSLEKPWRGENRFIERVFGVPAFKELYLARLREFSQTLFKPERFAAQVDELAAAIRPAIVEESELKLGRFDKVVQGEPVEPAGFGGPPGGMRRGGGGPGFGGPGRFMSPVKPIKTFVKARAASVNEQLAGTSKGQTQDSFGFGFGGGGRGGPGGPGGFGPGMFLARPFKDALDANKDGEVTQEEFGDGVKKWFQSWNKDQSGVLTEDQLRAGIDRDLSPFRGGPPGGPGFGPPGGGPGFGPGPPDGPRPE
jgi:spore coat protein CotH